MTKSELRGELKLQEPMSRHTSWRVGGPADRFYCPADVDDLSLFLQQQAADEPLFWLGLGSNLLVRDGGIRGTVIYTAGLLNEMVVLDAERIYTQAGVYCAKVARFATRNNLLGAEFLAGIPGTMGGALAMNAGAFGGETWPIVESVQCMDRFGELHQRSAADFDIAYRHVKASRDEWFISAILQLQSGDGEAAQARIKELLAKRGASQPTQKPSCGSVFTNPPGDYAARLIESAGLKNLCIGAACVSEKHANFIVNEGGASAAHIEELLHTVQQKVEQFHGVKLVPEVRIVGEEKR